MDTSSPYSPPQYSPTAPPYEDWPGRAHCVDHRNNGYISAELYPKITKEFKEFKDFKYWNTFQNKKTYLAKGNECKQELINEEILLEQDPAIPITNSTLPNRVVWTQPQSAPDPLNPLPPTVHNYFGPVINTTSHRECINCCEDCCEDMCENCCLDCSRLTDMSSIVIGSLLGKKTDSKCGLRYDLVDQNDLQESNQK